MIHTVTLKENDFLTHQLYEASTNPLRIKRRNRDYITIVVFVVLFALICYLEGKDLLFYFAGIYAIVVILFGKYDPAP
ncbi:MAG: hypothetical protein EOO92_12240 [Pedobacter sp.]|nr:MAG: hypothetical protein EOO92_12240 [Pedobacter sp.]